MSLTALMVRSSANAGAADTEKNQQHKTKRTMEESTEQERMCSVGLIMVRIVP